MNLSLTRFILLAALVPAHLLAGNGEEADPAEVTIGERLFLETRFAQSWNASPEKPDPALALTITTGKPLQGAFVGKTMSCRACHMVDEHRDDAGIRTYADFAAKSPIPSRDDGDTMTGRNSMSLVNIGRKDIANLLFHFDGEFNNMEDLVTGTFTGRNFGWRANEQDAAIRHIANVVRTDDGKGVLAQEFGGSYRRLLRATDKDIPADMRLPAEYRVDVDTASDKAILAAVARLVTAYTDSLAFATDDKGHYTGSPYDAFLKANKLPAAPASGESNTDYAQRLMQALETIPTAKTISGKDGKFATHSQDYRFGTQELRGMKLFFRAGSASQSGGNCASCHQAPHFTDFRFHNTGITQAGYDALHGIGSFMKLSIPGLLERNRDPARYLPATDSHPDAKSPFRAIAAKDRPGFSDLGLWNVFANPAMPAPQQKIRTLLCDANSPCNDESLLSRAIATFKTPGLRDTGHSAPYMHSGSIETLPAVVAMYISNSMLARQGRLRNADPEMSKVYLSGKDVDDLVAFIRSLNEDYE